MLRWVIRDIIDPVENVPRGTEKVLQEHDTEAYDLRQDEMENYGYYGDETEFEDFWRDIPTVDERVK